jgi:hypothetical protein
VLSGFGDKLAEGASPVDYSPVFPLSLGRYYGHFEEAFALVLKYGNSTDGAAVRANLKAQMTGLPSGKSSAILIFLLRFDPDADLQELGAWAEELAAREEPHGEWRVWDIIRFLGEKAWSCPRSIRRLVNEARAPDIIGQISLTSLAILLRTRPANVTVSLPSIDELAKAAINFAVEQNRLECVAALSFLPEFRTRSQSTEQQAT